MSRTIALLILVMTTAGCGTANGPSDVVRVDSAGVEIVTATGTDRPLPWTIESAFSLGGAESGPEAFYHVGILTVAVDDSGRIYVLDGAAQRVAVFDRQGEFITALGRAGRGPGELSAPGSIAAGSDGTIYVFDYGKGALVRFGPERDAQPEIPFRLFPSSGSSRHIAVSEDGILASGLIASGQANTFRQALQLITPNDTSILAERSFPEPQMVSYPSCGGGINLPRIFEPEVMWATRGRRIALAAAAEYSVMVLNGRQPIRLLRRNLPPREAREADAVAELGEGFRINFGRGPCVIPAAEMAAGRGYAEFIPWIEQLSITPRGEVWVLRKELNAGGGSIDVFDETGAYIGTLPRGTSFPLAFVDESRYVAAIANDMDVMRLIAYDLRRRQD